MNKLAFNPNLAFSLFVITRKNIRDNGFAGPIFAEQRMDLARSHVEIQFIENQMLPDTGKSFRESPRFKQNIALIENRTGI